MDTKNIYLFVFDTKENFEKSKKHLGSERSAFKRVICVEDEFEFEKEFQSIPENELVFMVVHVFYTDQINGIKRFVASRIEKQYPHLGFMFISDGDKKEINKQMVDADIPYRPVYKYHQVQSELEEGKAKVHTKKEIIQWSVANSQIALSTNNNSNIEAEAFPNCDYAIITALEETEMEKVLPMIQRTGTFPNNSHLIEYGHFKSNPAKTIVYASQLDPGMVDAAILTTELIIRFKPSFLIMVGVLGGKPNEVNIGDAVVATKVFTIDKGKITDTFKPEIESSDTNSAIITKIKREKESIISFVKTKDITRDKRINIHFGPITCVRQVIDSEGYFDEKILPVDRKAIALEMESFGVARACRLVNDGKTQPLIIKSAMDNTIDKTDGSKPLAASTSAWVLEYILDNGLI